MKIIQLKLDDETHGEFKMLCAREKTYMKRKLEQLILDFIKNVKTTSEEIHS